MRLEGSASWRISVRRWERLLDTALWIRAAERLRVPADRLVPGPLDAEDLPAPDPTVDRDVAGQQWLDWWYTLLDAPHRPAPSGPRPAPTYGATDPLGLAGLPDLARVVTRRSGQALGWLDARRRAEPGRDFPPPTADGQVVREVEVELGRAVRPFAVEFILLPVRDDAVREVDQRRFLVPELVYTGPKWSVWLGDLVRRTG